MRLHHLSREIAFKLLPYDTFDEIALAAASGALSGQWAIWSDHTHIEFECYEKGFQLCISRKMNVSATNELGHATKGFSGVRALLQHYGELP